jgi:hypothetical protein
MSLTQLIKSLVIKKFDEYCKKRVPERAQDQVRLSYKFRGNSVTIFENRPPWNKEIKEWTSVPVAQIRYDEKTGKWTLYCADRNDKWHEYYDIEPTKEIDKLLKEIDEDPTGIFWG